MTTSYTTDQRFQGGLFVLVLVTFCALFISTLAIDNSGRKDNNHVEPLPASVSQLSGTAYIVEKGDITAFELCAGTSSGENEEISETAQIPKLDAIYVECSQNQTWNDDRPKSKNFGHAFIEVVTLPWTWLTFAALFLVCFAPAGVSLLSDRRDHKEKVAAARQEAAQRLSEGIAKHDALVRLWTAQEISDSEYEEQFGKLVETHPELIDRKVLSG